MATTVGEIRQAMASMGDRAWTVAVDLADDDPIPLHALGGNMSEHPVTSVVGPQDLSAVLAETSSNPLLRARNLQVLSGAAPIDVQISIGLDWRDRWGGRWLATIQNQNPCNNCWAFAATALVETMVRIEHGIWAKRSEGDLRDGWGGPTGENWIVRDGPEATPCAHGAGVTGALDWVTANGLADPDCYAWSSMDKTYAPTPDRSGRTVRVPKYTDVGDVASTKRWLDSVGPVVAGFDVFTDFDVWAGPEVYRRVPAATPRGSHILLVVGYNDTQQCWIVRNSWGPGWGQSGYGLVGYGECNIDAYAKFGLRDTNPDPWSKRRLHAGNFFESGNGVGHRNFEMVRGSAPRARHLWRDGGSEGFVWHEAATLENPNDIAAGAGCVGQPAATSTTYNRNFEAVYWELSGRLRHWWMDQEVNAWHDGGQFGPTDTEGFPAFIQSSYGAPGNLEVVVRRRGGVLAHWWREGAPSFAWHDGGTITEGVKMSGPSLVQANVGSLGNFYLVCVTNFGSMQLWWRNDDGDHAWTRGEVFGSGVGETPVCMIQGEFGASDELATGNFELCVAAGGQVQHWWRDNSALKNEAPRADNADPRFSDVVHAHEPVRRFVTDDEQSARLDLSGLLDDTATLAVSRSARSALTNAVLGHADDRIFVNEGPLFAGIEAADRWQRTAVFGHDVKHVWGLVQGSFGFNLDVVVETSEGALQHYYRDGEGWHEGVIIDA